MIVSGVVGPKKLSHNSICFVVALLLALGGLRWSHADEFDSAISGAGSNESEIRRALHETTHPEVMKFLVANMPASDLQMLSADFLIEHVELATQARKAAKWGQQIPEEVFLNEVVPYANVNERRDNVRRELRDRFWPVVRDMDSISLAAAKLNQEVFKQLKVKYSTKRRRADQGPSETMESGLASCTGLSILLIDACRACGIPARFVGTPMWKNMSGNHSWVEIWDDGWHFTGAAEPTGNDLDKGWFVGRASKQIPGSRRHGIFAVSFKKTDSKFPLVWTRNAEVYCLDVTEHYTRSAAPASKGMITLEFQALEAKNRNRCVANLIVRDDAQKVVFRGQTNDDSSDTNNHLQAKLKPGTYEVELKSATGSTKRKVTVTKDGQLVSIVLDDKKPVATTETPKLEKGNGLGPDVISQLKNFLSANGNDLSKIDGQEFASKALTKAEAKEATSVLAKARLDYVRANRKAEHEGKLIKIGDKEMLFDFRVFGDAPDAGHSLYISMHGGGGTAKRVNDGQWRNQIRLYSLEEGIYVAPRAPTDTWNLWHQAHIDEFFTRLIENMIAFEGINPNRVYLTGYSAGGDGVFQLAPRMADQLAAAAMMAGHPNETKPDGLRNLPFTLHMGEKDAAYKRNQKAAEWKEALGKLKSTDSEGYEHWVEIHAGKGHWMDRQDAKGVEWMGQFERKITPDKVVWLQDDVLHERFYWLAVPKGQAKARTKITASRDGNLIEIAECDSEEVQFLLRDAMMDLDQPVTVKSGDRVLFSGKVNRTISTLAETIGDRGDMAAAFPARVLVKMP